MTKQSLIRGFFRAIRVALPGIAMLTVLPLFSGPAAAAGLGSRPDTSAGPFAGAAERAQYYYPPPGYYAPPPGYYAPPRYYPPAQPPVYYPPAAPPQRDLNRAYDPDRDGPLGYPTQRSAPAVPYSAMCYAGPYTCQMPVAGPVGSGCSCPGLGAPSYGSLR